MLNGYNTTLLAYGITGTGKTYTIFGDCYKYPKNNKSGQLGVSSLVIQELFRQIAEEGKSKEVDFVVKFSYLEIYNEHVRDMLSKDKTKNLQLTEDP